MYLYIYMHTYIYIHFIYIAQHRPVDMAFCMSTFNQKIDPTLDPEILEKYIHAYTHSHTPCVHRDLRKAPGLRCGQVPVLQT